MNDSHCLYSRIHHAPLLYSMLCMISIKTPEKTLLCYDEQIFQFSEQYFMYHKNAGSKSTAKDSQGRNPLEIASVPGDGRVAVTLIYHAVDDPVAANQAYGFSVAGITFANSKDGLVTIPTVGKVSSFKATAQSKALKLTWKKASVSGYEIQYSTSKSFAKSKTATIRVAKTKTAYTIKKLGGGQKYYVRIRAYKNYKDELGQTVKAYGKWSSAVSKTTKK